MDPYDAFHPALPSHQIDDRPCRPDMAETEIGVLLGRGLGRRISECEPVAREMVWRGSTSTTRGLCYAGHIIKKQTNVQYSCCE